MVGQFIDEVFELASFVHCALDGIGYSLVAVRVTEAVKSYGRFKDESAYQRQRGHYEKLELFGKTQMDKGHPYLFGLACVKLCSILEASVDFVIAALLKRPETVTSSTRLMKLKGPLIQFTQASEADRIAFLSDALKQEIASDLKIGVGRFESLLDQVGFGGNVGSGVKKALLELIEMRNVIVHRMGRVDNQLISRCPWLSMQIGEAVNLNAETYRIYEGAVFWYLIELDQRWEEKIESGGRKADASSLQNDIEQDISSLKRYSSPTSSSPIA